MVSRAGHVQRVLRCLTPGISIVSDWGYERKLRPKPGDPSATTDNPGLCVPAATPPLHANPFSQHSQCSSSKTFRVTKGCAYPIPALPVQADLRLGVCRYRRVPGDTCEGGAEFDAIEVCTIPLNSRLLNKLFPMFCRRRARRRGASPPARWWV